LAAGLGRKVSAWTPWEPVSHLRIESRMLPMVKSGMMAWSGFHGNSRVVWTFIGGSLTFRRRRGLRRAPLLT